MEKGFMETKRDCTENGEITNRDIYLAQIEMASNNSQATFDMLRDILTKFFPTLFYLNGGAAIAVLAFIGEFVNYDDKYLVGILYALLCFAAGAFLTTGALGVSYLSQTHFQGASGMECVRISGIEGVCSKEIQDKELAIGIKWRKAAIGMSIFAGVCFYRYYLIFV